MTRALLVYPEFRSASFWNYRETCKLVDARYPAAPLGLCTVAALLPADWELTLVDRNIEPWEDSMLDPFDVILTGGMMPQQRDCLDLIRKARQRGKRVVVGGPDATSSPHLYSDADHLVLGEGEVTMPQFLADLAAGTPRKIYQDARKADVQTSPTPRFDLLKFDRYNHIGIQWCRGCPFSCEFCDIIELFGKVPRAKSSVQILVELQKLYDLGYRGHVDLVDDNFIGNKKLVKQFLPELKKWLEERNWPFEFTTEASINLADDPALMQLMQEVGFFAIFVGIESPDEETLVAMQKRQNTHRSIAESIHKIYAHGMFVNAGFIIGFDTEKGSVARGIIRCIEETGIPVNMAGLLFALPTTQLTKRLAAAGRLHENFDVAPDGVGDQCTAGINFDPCRPRADIFRDYLQVVETIYTPKSYFSRVLDVGRRLDSSKRRFKPGFRQWLKELKGFSRMALKLGFQRSTCGVFWSTLAKSLVQNPGSIRYVGSLMALYLHFGPFAGYVAGKIQEAIALEERTPSKIAPPPPPVQMRVTRPVPAAGA
ncbi:MAG TPA: B12-binding domain-containing radical SAM protein [Planctomycetota bacterium]|nr:B12-binding domain-containing radical SAM protein [Planctomycetota bacterium]